MRVLVAFDKFKDALTAAEACTAAASALRGRHPDWQLDLCPLTDGGDGFTALLTEAAHGRLERVEVSGPRGQPVPAMLGWVEAARLPPAARVRLPAPKTVAVADLASASGLALLEPAGRNPWQTTTAGVGEVLRHAAAKGPEAILLGLGGSATNDLGLGALHALGLRFIDTAGGRLEPPQPGQWHRLARIEGQVRLPPLFLACDVTNPLLGPSGATATYGPQKGLPPADVPEFERQAARAAALLCDHCRRDRALADAPGAGAAGGTAFGLMVAAGATLVPGSDLVSDWLNLPDRIAAADLVITGEGRFDATSLAGKAPGRLVAHAQRLGRPVQVFAGGLGVPEDREHHAITPAGMPLTEALPRTAELLAANISLHC